jgi:D-sedoheptulose 7-phosphate isomerase
MVNSLSDSASNLIDTLRSLTNLKKEINFAIKKIYYCIKNKKKIFICGNGGSAADSQHLAAEFLVRLRPKVNRSPWPIISLAQDAAVLTACGNDYGFQKIFSRTLEALFNKGDILICFSTSGKSKNIIEVLKFAKKNKIFSISFLGKTGGSAKNLTDHPIIVKNNNTARVQEAHIFLGHFILEQVETRLMNL